MATKQELEQQARSLGQEIADSERAQAYFTAQRAVEADQDAQSMLGEYSTVAQRIQQLQQSGQAVEPDDKRRIAELEQQLSANPLVKTLMKTQADYMELMNGINQALTESLTEAEQRGSQA